MPFCRLYLPLSPALVERIGAEHTHLVGWRQSSGAERLHLFEFETAIGAWPWLDPAQGVGVARGLTLDLRHVHELPFFVDLLNARAELMTVWRADEVALSTPHISVVLASRMSVVDKGVIDDGAVDPAVLLD